MTILNHTKLLSHSYCTLFLVSTHEKMILTEFFLSTNGESWLRNLNWKTQKSTKYWEGVIIALDGRVSRLILLKNGLSG